MSASYKLQDKDQILFN